MRLRLAAAVCALLLPPLAAQAQYDARPVPRTTDVPTLRAEAVAREVRERISRGNADDGRGDWNAAIEEYRAALARQPAEPQGSTAHYDLGTALAHAGRDAEAQAELREAIRLDPGFLAAYANLIAVESRLGDRRAARATADTLVALAPDAARGLYERGLLALESGDLGTAAADFGKLSQRNPRYAPAHYDLALVAVRAGRLGDAERELTTALALAADFPRARFALGLVFLREGRREDARVAFEQVLRGAADPTLRTAATAMRDQLGVP